MRLSKAAKLPLMTLAAMAAGVPVAASGAGFYVGAGALGSNLEPRVNDAAFTVTETKSSGARVFAGMNVGRRISLEGYYSDLGVATLTGEAVTGEISYETGGLSGLFYLYSSRGDDGLTDREGLMLYGRAGIGLLENSSTSGIVFNSLNGEHLAFGLGVEYNHDSGLGVRAEFLNHDADARDVSLNLLYRFGRSSNDSAVSDAIMSEPPGLLANPEQPQQEAPQEIVAPPPPPPPPPPVPVEPAPAAVPDQDADGVPDAADLCVGTVSDATVDINGCVFSGVIKGIHFDSGSASLTPAGYAVLDMAINELTANPDIRISVQSHTDNRGDATGNMELSRQRAVTLIRYLADIGNINLGRMEAVAFGESQPLESNGSAEGRAANRRVEIQIIE